ncbi:MAG: beta-galactosidase GalB, partial [Spirochaetia bacterium]
MELRQVQLLKYGWKFFRGAAPGAENERFDDSGWETVRVPHDWAIRGPFSRENDLQRTSVMEDGVVGDQVHTGRTGALPITGTGWYRKVLNIPAEMKGKRIFLEFDGVMSNSTVYLNGTAVGGRPYGYSSFTCDITESIRFTGENLLAVKAEPQPFSSRWYPGAGIYRNVRLTAVDPVYVPYCGTYITVPEIGTKNARVHIETEVVNQKNRPVEASLDISIIDPDGVPAASAAVTSRAEQDHVFVLDIDIRNPRLWDTGKPDLYTAVITVKADGEPSDEYKTSFGIRSIAFDAERGFRLNGRSLKLKGVCQHHDLGALGAAVNIRALERQLEILREMGSNAVRTSHNPPAPELLDLCDRMGFLVIDEAFDEWRKGKVGNGYHRYFDQWAERDLRDMIRRDRNHPSVIMWSIGNEIREQESADGAETARFLTGICHREDPTRPVTAGFNNPRKAIPNGLPDAVDIPGWNYGCGSYAEFHREHPEWIAYGSETESCISSRGEYFFPAAEEKEPVPRPNLHVSSYDLAAPPWGYPPEYEFRAQDELPYILGEFVWTGFDYLGEPTPYREEWPSRSSYFGIVDLAGIPKDRYYLYQSVWTDKDVLHLLPHWNWEGREGAVIPVHCYTGFPRVELFLNGRSLGVREKTRDKLFGRYRLIWDDVVYEPGELKAAAYDAAGNERLVRTVKTAGPADGIGMNPDRSVILADGDDLSFVTVSFLDREGNLCPRADNLVQFSLSGPGEIAGVDNGDQTSLEPFQADRRKAFNGMCVLIVRSLK